MGKIMWYLPRKYWSPNTFKALLILELPVTIALLALVGIASPNLYRTRLWEDGGENGFNSHPRMMVYELANYRSYEVPRVWTRFVTGWNLVITVLSMFFLLVKAPMFILNVFYPPLSILVHSPLLAVYVLAATFQAGSDMSDPEHPQPGPPWYITKNCNVAHSSANIGYCQQAKATFCCAIVCAAIFLAHIILAIISCFPTQEIREKQRERLNRRTALEELKSMKSPLHPPNSAYPLMTPRTTAFHQLGGTVPTPKPQMNGNGSNNASDSDLNDKTDLEGQGQQGDYFAPNPEQQVDEHTQYARQPQHQPQPIMYFPPPPKKASKK